MRACERLGGEGALSISSPATEAEVAAVEHALGLDLPRSFRAVLLDVASSFDLSWYLPDEREPPFKGIFSGRLSWDVARIVSLEEARKEWIRVCFPDENEPYDRVWHRKLATQDVPNGDMLGLDLAIAEAPLVYLSHDDGEGHGFALGTNFEDAIARWLKLGCVGAEDWQWLPFVGGRDSGLEPEGERARRWRDWFGIDRVM